MNYIERIKKTLVEGSEKVVKIAEDVTGKLKEVGEEGIEFSREMIAELSEKATDVVNIGKYKVELNDLDKKIGDEYVLLGELGIKYYTSKSGIKTAQYIQDKIGAIAQLHKDYMNVNSAYEELRKSYSDSFVINKLGDELAEGDATIDQAVVKKTSVLSGKALRDIPLPKEALISAIKRGHEVIIPDGNTRLAANDKVTIIGKTEDVLKVKKKLSS